MRYTTLAFGESAEVYATFQTGDVVDVEVIEGLTPAGAAATFDIQAVAKAQTLNGETFTLDDGINTPTIFEFNDDAGGAPAAGSVDVDTQGDVTAEDIAISMRAAIDGVGSTLLWTTDGAPTAGGLLSLTHDYQGTVGNTTQSDTVADAGFTFSPNPATAGTNCGAQIALDNDKACETVEPGLFAWDTADITTQPTSTTQYIIKFTNQRGAEHLSKVIFGNSENASVIGAYSGAIWVSATDGVAGTVVGVNGLPTNPVLTLDDAKTIGDAIGLKKIVVLDALFGVDMNDNFSGWTFEGQSSFSTIDVNGQSAIGTTFRDVRLDGDCSLSTITMFGGEIATTATNLSGFFHDVSFSGTVDLAAATSSIFDSCYSGVPGAGQPTLSFASNSDASVRAYSGGLRLSDITTDTVDATIEFVAGNCIIDASCTATGPDVQIRGVATLTNNGSFTPTTDALLTPGDIALEASVLLNKYQGSVWFSTGTEGSAGAVVGVNGTPDLPVNNFADLLTLLSSTNLSQVQFLEGLMVTTSALPSGTSICGRDGTILLYGAHSLAPITVYNCIVSGSPVGTAGGFYVDCRISDISNWEASCLRCGLGGTIALATNPDIFFDRCYSTEAGLGNRLIVDMPASNADVMFRSYSGGVEFQNIDTGTAVNVSVDMVGGNVVIDSSCTLADPNVDFAIRGIATFTNAGAFTPTVDALVNVPVIADATWEEATADHTDNTTFGGFVQKLLTLAKFIGLK